MGEGEREGGEEPLCACFVFVVNCLYKFGFQYLIIIYINFKFNSDCIKHYIHGGLSLKMMK